MASAPFKTTHGRVTTEGLHHALKQESLCEKDFMEKNVESADLSALASVLYSRLPDAVQREMIASIGYKSLKQEHKFRASWQALLNKTPATLHPLVSLLLTLVEKCDATLTVLQVQESQEPPIVSILLDALCWLEVNPRP